MTSDNTKHAGRWLWWWAGLVAAAVVSLPVWVFWWRSRDIPRPATDDLVMTRLVISADDDAFTHFERAAAALAWPPGLTLIKDYREDCAKRLGKSEELVENNAEALRHLKTGLARKVCAGPQRWTVDNTFPFTRLKQLALVLAIQARLHLRDGRRDEALATCRELIGYGEMLRQRPPGQVALLIGHVVTATGLETVRLLANDPGVTGAELAGLAELLAMIAPPEQGMAIALRVEFMWSVGLIDRLESGEVPWSKVGDFKRHALLDGFQFQPNRTRLLLAEQARAALEALAPPAAAGMTPDAGEDERWGGGSVGRNIVGRTLAEYGTDSARISAQRKANMEMVINGARLVVALRRYETRTGALPATLEALVPDYLPAVPANTLTDRPFRYLPGERMIHADRMEGGNPTRFSLRPEDTAP